MATYQFVSSLIFLFLFSCFQQGSSVYFLQNELVISRSHAEVNMTIYNVKCVLEPDDVGFITYKIAPSHAKQICPRLSIHPKLGHVEVIEIPKGTLMPSCTYNIMAYLNGTAGHRHKSTDSVELTLNITKSSEEEVVENCRHMSIEEMCFDGLSTLELQVIENSESVKSVLLGNAVKVCEKAPLIQYSLSIVEEDVMSLQDDLGDFLLRNALWVRSNLDREATSQYNFSVTCTVKVNSTDDKNVTIAGSLVVLDQDDNPPESQKGTQHVTMFIDLRENSNGVEEGSRLNTVDSTDVLILDRDTVETNNFETNALNDTKEILSFHTAKYQGRHTEMTSTAAILQIVLTKKLKDIHVWQDLYCVAVVMNDTTLVKKIPNSEMRYTVCLHWGHRAIPEQKTELTSEELHSLLSNGIYEHRFNRKSSMHALVMYPFPDLIRDVSELPSPDLNFKIEKFQVFSHSDVDLARNYYYGTEDETDCPISVTSRTGIIYAINSNYLRDSSVKYISLRLIWKATTNDSQQVENGANITIFLDGDASETEKNETLCDAGSCAEFAESPKCVSSCGFGSVKNCVWLPRRAALEQNSIASSSNTSIPNLDYATCTASLQTCPDRKCDELESMQPHRCPQDCTTEVNGVSRLIQRINGEKYGIESGIGVCSCHSRTSCSCSHLPSSSPSYATPTSSSGSASQSSTPHFRPISSSPEEPTTGLIQPSDALCGKTCMIFVVGLILVLMTFMFCTFICICKARLSMQRKSRNLKPNMSINPSDMIVSGMYGHGLENGNIINDADYMRSGVNSDPYHGRTNAHYGCGDYLIVDTKWEIPRNCLLLEQVLGEGEFGRVLKGKAHNMPNHEGTLDVAVKMLKDNHAENGKSCRQEFMAEFSLLQQVDHPNVIKLLGACTSPGGPPFLIMEYAEMGSLRSFLRRCRRVESVSSSSSVIVWSEPQSPSHAVLTFHPSPVEQDAYLKETQYIVTPQEVLGFSWQIAKGMAYLSDMKMVHRDLAARNILLTKSKVCKISDFGLTRDIYVDDAYKKKSKDRVPVKWLALECLADELYTTKSDVWAFGILLWELATLGASPYPGIQNEQLYQLLKSGYRMQQPVNCSTELYQLMLHCWATDVANRPTFHQLVNAISKLLEDGIEYLKLDIPTVNNPGYDYFLQNENANEIKDVAVDSQIAQPGQPKVATESSMENLRLIDHEISTNEDFESNSTGYNNFVHTYMNEPKSSRESRWKTPVNAGYESPIKIAAPISKE